MSVEIRPYIGIDAMQEIEIRWPKHTPHWSKHGESGHADVRLRKDMSSERRVSTGACRRISTSSFGHESCELVVHPQ